MFPVPSQPRAGITILEDLGLENAKMVIPALPDPTPARESPFRRIFENAKNGDSRTFAPTPARESPFWKNFENAKMVIPACVPYPDPPPARESPFWKIWALKMQKCLAPPPRAGITILEDLGLENAKMVIPARVSLAPPCPPARAGITILEDLGLENDKMVICLPGPSLPSRPRGNHHFGRFGP